MTTVFTVTQRFTASQQERDPQLRALATYADRLTRLNILDDLTVDRGPLGLEISLKLKFADPTFRFDSLGEAMMWIQAIEWAFEAGAERGAAVEASVRKKAAKSK